MNAQVPASEPAPKSHADSVHPLVRVGAEWTWRLLVLFAGLLAIGYIVQELATVMIPLAIALLGAAMLAPMVNWMQRQGVPRSAAVVVAIVGSISVLAGILTFVVEQFIEGLPQLVSQFSTSIEQVQNWLTDGPLHFSEDQIRSGGDSLRQALESNQDSLTSGALTTAAVIGEILTGSLLALFILIFFLYGGEQIWDFLTRIVPTDSRRRVRVAGRQGFGSLVGFVRATVAVAAVDAIGIGAGLAILGVPLALPLASLVFIGAFVPIIGAFVAGFVAVFIALVTKGLLTALITFGIIVAVMQLEGHVLQPLLLGRAVRVHPLAVVLAITAGLVVAGIAGALFAVPLVAFLNTAIRSLLVDEPDEVFEEQTADMVTGPSFAATPDEPDKPDKPDEPAG
ncbi:AI-2E family transporter [Antrihabitans sp. YC3-6]|uniref:AI-2E family transporter n=1 Tax=Antrihabitans stalagmiti TaxID=2799499 RepID=A0A934NPY4_9NOCA|nr:AI-2E family transporter [Antrihabitans stalagmiti]MBJ8339266.1 AI-2E family transporter [Antrihabitans stalagmiti]